MSMNDCEEVVEIVRDSPGELADAVQLLRMIKHFLGGNAALSLENEAGLLGIKSRRENELLLFRSSEFCRQPDNDKRSLVGFRSGDQADEKKAGPGGFDRGRQQGKGGTVRNCPGIQFIDHELDE